LSGPVYGNNVFASSCPMAAQGGFDFELVVHRPGKRWNPEGAAERALHTEPRPEQSRGADLVVTDTWVSMHGPSIGARTSTQPKLLRGYQVMTRVWPRPKPERLYFMHALPRTADDEFTSSVMDGELRVIFDEAENRFARAESVHALVLGK